MHTRTLLSVHKVYHQQARKQYATPQAIVVLFSVSRELMATSVGIVAVKQPADNGCQQKAAIQGAQKKAHGMVPSEELVRLLLVKFEFMAAAG